MTGAFSELRAAYEGLESPDAFIDAAAVEAYRESMLERSRPQADRLESLASGDRILEVACGNGRLLIEMARRGRVRQGVGIDIAASRIAFARDWAAAERHDQLDFQAADVFDVGVGSGAFDTVVCITGAFAYFDPVRAGAARDLLVLLRHSLVRGGTLLLELYQHPNELRLIEAAGGELRQWKELDRSDPWRFYLSHFVFGKDRVLSHAKTFIHRTSGAIDEGRRERLRIYTPDEVIALLADTGFERPQLTEGWTDAPYAGGEILVAAARAV